MADDQHPTAAQAKKNADEIEDQEKIRTATRGNVYSEIEEGLPDQEPVPPLAH